METEFEAPVWSTGSALGPFEPSDLVLKRLILDVVERRMLAATKRGAVPEVVRVEEERKATAERTARDVAALNMLELMQ